MSKDATYKYDQIRENIKFYFNIGKECKKRNEKAELDELAKDINHFANNDESGENGEPITQVDIAKRLYEIFKNIVTNRNKYSSDLVDRLNGKKSNYDFIHNYPSDSNDIDTKDWLKNVVKCICNGTIRVGNFTVFRGDIKDAMADLKKKLEEDLNLINKDENSNEELDLTPDNLNNHKEVISNKEIIIKYKGEIH